MSRYVLSPLAQADVHAIWEYIGIQNDRPDAARRLIDTFFEKFAMLARHPMIGQFREDLADLVPDIRSFSVGNYVLYYQPCRNGVMIGRVVHGARDARALFT